MATATNLQSELQKILDGLGKMPSIVGELANVVARFANALNPLQSAISRLIGSAEDTVLETSATASQITLTSAINRNSAVTDANTAATNRLSATVGSLNSTLAGLIARMNASLQRQGLDQLGGRSPLMLGGGGGAAPPGEGGGGAAGGISGGLGSLGRLAAVAGVAAAAIGVMVVGINLAQQEFQKLQGFVKLFNPAVIQAFQFALDNLGATIGRAFVPMFQAATSVVREWTAALAPVIQQLTPWVQQLSSAFADIAVTMFQQLASVLRSMIPLMQRWGEQLLLIAQFGEPIRAQIGIAVRAIMLWTKALYELTGMGTVIRVLTKVMEAFSKVFEVVEAAFSIMETVVTSLVDSFSTFLQSLFSIQGMMEALNRAIQTVIRNMYVFAIMMAKFLGLDGVVKALLDSIEDKTKRGDTAAQSPQIKGLEQLSKDLALAASTAAGAAGVGGVRNEQEFWKGTLEQMRLAKDNQVSMLTLLSNILAELKRIFPGGGGGAVPPAGPGQAGPGGVQGGGMPWGDIPGIITNPFGFLGRKALGI